MSPITTHVLDTARGRPAAGIPIRLERRGDDGIFTELGAGHTDEDGRLEDLLGEGSVEVGIYRMVFETGAYLLRTAGATFYPEVTVLFSVDSPDQHYHVPLLLSPFGYSTYRGS